VHHIRLNEVNYDFSCFYLMLTLFGVFMAIFTKIEFALSYITTVHMHLISEIDFILNTNCYFLVLEIYFIPTFIIATSYIDGNFIDGFLVESIFSQHYRNNLSMR